jgi:putative tryptophan/tyrosine transport system substrate-binding protein
LGVTLLSMEVQSPHEFGSAFAALREERPDALLMTADPLHQLHVDQILALAAKDRLAVVSNVRENVAAGALLSHGASHRAVFRQAAVYVDKIVKGAKPGDLPMHQPTQFELVINLKTAEALGLTIPPSLLFQADEVIR